MVTLKVKGEWFIDTSSDIVLNYFGYGDSFSRSQKSFTATDSYGYKTVFGGNGFKYGKDGFAVGGSSSKDYVATLSVTNKFVDGGVFYTGLKVKLSDFAKYEKTASPIDDAKFWEFVFKGNDKLTGGVNLDYIYGHDGNDKILGAGGHDVLDGGRGNDIIHGGIGNDELTGGDGNDRLNGGSGTDVLIGGKGADIFVFTDPRHTVDRSYERDEIEDFNRAEKDKIDVKSIDANINKGGDQAFVLIGTNSFNGKAGEIRYEHSNGETIVQGDIDGDALIDFAFEIESTIDLIKSDFIL